MSKNHNQNTDDYMTYVIFDRLKIKDEDTIVAMKILSL